MRDKRMQLATTLLESHTIPIKEIAERTGYRTQHYFSFSFKEYFGVPPSSWKENNMLSKEESIEKRQGNLCK
ncbi:helix-turn-helix domain-containing protein [uncultured Sphaerochaeta sp.]|uniref:helix-turn-helix domain-containing protein n=1 Tax=uncultured Sphaerochaeta sp. TaxID=886478 RepID=UPI002A0A3DFD|nr:helix-turn-helix domain-containing protein [uncultured Sphaerochaeta sp.]